MECLVLWLKNSDSPGGEIKRVYIDERSKAEADLELCSSSSWGTWVLSTADLFMDGVLTRTGAQK